MANSSNRPNRHKTLCLETDPETKVERSICHDRRNTLFVFIYEETCVSRGLNSIAWPRGYSDEAKLASQPGEYEIIRHNHDPPRMLYLGRGPVDIARKYKKQPDEIYKKGQQPPFLLEGPETISATQPAATLFTESPYLVFSSPEPTGEATQIEKPQTCPEKGKKGLVPQKLSGNHTRRYNQIFFYQKRQQRLTKQRYIDLFLRNALNFCFHCPIS